MSEYGTTSVNEQLQREISRLKGELEETKKQLGYADLIAESLEHLFADLNERYACKADALGAALLVIDEYEKQLSEARTETERFKHMAEQNSTEMCEWMEKYNEARAEFESDGKYNLGHIAGYKLGAASARQEAARECLVVVEKHSNSFGYYILKHIKDRFKLGGVRDEK